ncbi:MAG: hypothetical protein Q7S40_24330 [Opitutaceae bacterium]|nr:hypothetical protein [Opitutaceae bacterium]
MTKSESPGILYCNCTYAQIIDPAVKAAVLRQLLDSGRSFEAVADLCEMSARKDPALKRLACGANVKIAACYPRAVKWLFASSGAPLTASQTEVLNMRELAAPQVVERLLATDLQPNLPAGKATASGSTPGLAQVKDLPLEAESAPASAPTNPASAERTAS